MTTRGAADNAVTEGSGPTDDRQQLEAEIQRTREQLGETVEALASKADVKARARDKARQFTGRLEGMAGRAKQQATAAAASVSGASPEPVQRAAVKAAATVRQHRVPLAVIVGAVVLAWPVIAWWRRR